jgi:hypothetical protein
MKERWQLVDKKLDKHIKLYNRLTLELQDDIQSVFDSIKWDFEDANKPIASRVKLLRLVELWREEGLLKGSFGDKVRRVVGKRNISQLEALGLMIEAIYIRRKNKLNDEELIKDIAREAYDREITKYKGKTRLLDDFLIMLMSIPNPNGYIWGQYIGATSSFYAGQVQNQVLINLQQDRELNIDNIEFQKILETDRKRYLNKKKEPLVDKYSGALDTEVSFVVNRAVLKAYEDLGIEQVRFVSVIDGRTSKMCRSLDGQIFFVNKLNDFFRYSQLEGGEVNYKIKGLISGVNLPPINDGFHYCRSTIIAMR